MMVPGIMAFLRNPRLVMDRVIERPDTDEQAKVAMLAYVLSALSAIISTISRLYLFPGFAGVIYRELMGRYVVRDAIVSVILNVLGTFVILRFFVPIVQFIHAQLGQPFSPQAQVACRRALPWIICASNALGLVTPLLPLVVGLLLFVGGLYLQYMWWKHLQDRLRPLGGSPSLSFAAIAACVGVYAAVHLGLSFVLHSA